MLIKDKLSQLEKLLASPPGAREEIAALVALAELLLDCGAYPEAQVRLEQALALSHRHKVAEAGMEAYLLLARLLLLAGDKEKAASLLDKVEAALPPSGPELLRRQAAAVRLLLLQARGDELAARDLLAHLPGGASPSGDSGKSGDSGLELLLTFLRAEITGDLDETFRARELARQAGHPFLALRAELALARLYWGRGEPGTAFAHARNGLEQLHDLASALPAPLLPGFWKEKGGPFRLSGMSPLPGREADLPGTASPTAAGLSLPAALRLLENYRRINRQADLEPLLLDLLDTLLSLVPAERGVIVIRGRENRPALEVVRNFGREGDEEGGVAREISRTALNAAVATGRMVLTGDAQSCRDFFGAASIARLRLQSILALPLRVGEETIGAVYLDNRFQENAFDTAHVQLVEQHCEQFILAIEQNRLLTESLARQREVELLHRRLEEKLEVQAREMAALRSQAPPPSGIVGESRPVQDLLERVEKVKNLDVPVLLWGESGTGKELLARSLHYGSRWEEGKFVSINCGALPAAIIASELFGHAKGAFTGAEGDKAGLFEQAQRGTLFLDELSDLPPDLQKQLLRVLQEKVVRRVGGTDEIKLEVRVVAALNRDPEELVKDGKLREDLYYRLNVISLPLPPLRERKEDIPLLAEHFLGQEQASGGTARKFTPEAMSLLMQHPWPGNVRELGNLVKRLLACQPGEELTAEMVRQELSTAPQLNEGIYFLPFKQARREALDQFEREYFARALRRNQGNRKKTAREIGIRHSYVHKILERRGMLSRGGDEGGDDKCGEDKRGEDDA